MTGWDLYLYAGGMMTITLLAFYYFYHQGMKNERIRWETEKQASFPHDVVSPNGKIYVVMPKADYVHLKRGEQIIQELLHECGLPSTAHNALPIFFNETLQRLNRLESKSVRFDEWLRMIDKNIDHMDAHGALTETEKKIFDTDRAEARAAGSGAQEKR